MVEPLTTLVAGAALYGATKAVKADYDNSAYLQQLGINSSHNLVWEPPKPSDLRQINAHNHIDISDFLPKDIPKTGLIFDRSTFPIEFKKLVQKYFKKPEESGYKTTKWGYTYNGEIPFTGAILKEKKTNRSFPIPLSVIRPPSTFVKFFGSKKSYKDFEEYRIKDNGNGFETFENPSIIGLKAFYRNNPIFVLFVDMYNPGKGPDGYIDRILIIPGHEYPAYDGLFKIAIEIPKIPVQQSPKDPPEKTREKEPKPLPLPLHPEEITRIGKSKVHRVQHRI